MLIVRTSHVLAVLAPTVRAAAFMAWYLFSWKTIGGALIPKREPALQVILTMTHIHKTRVFPVLLSFQPGISSQVMGNIRFIGQLLVKRTGRSSAAKQKLPGPTLQLR